LDRKHPLDEKLYQHIKHVTSLVAHELKTKRLTKDCSDAIGKLLFRLYKVTTVYRKQRKGVALASAIRAIESFGLKFVEEYRK